MVTLTFAQVMTQLGVTKKQLLFLMQNPTFPTETGGTASDAATFLDTDINAFQTKWHTAGVNGFVMTESLLKTANFNALATATAGSFQAKSAEDPVDVMLVENLGKVPSP
jgi:hypothetical protein